MDFLGLSQSRFCPIRLSCAMMLALLVFSAACSKGPELPAQKKPGMAAPVKVAKAELKDVPLQIEAVGNIEAFSTVAVTAQISGQIEKIHFKEGQRVKEGDLLVTIDPRPYKAVVAQGEAVLARDMAQMETARREAARYGGLVANGYVSQSQYDQIKSSADSLQSVVAADKAAVDNAKLQLGYCFIHSPITGQTGVILIDEGNAVKANDKTLVTIMQVKPLYANFSVPQQYLHEINKRQAAGKLRVAVSPPGSGLPPVNGVLTFIDNSVDSATGTIKLKAAFDSSDKLLWPGQFVKASLLLSTEKGAVVIPSQAVMASQKGQSVYVVKPDGSAEMRIVTVSRVYGEESLIASGIEAGETVVIDGQLQILPGGKVKVSENRGGDKGQGK